MSNQEDMSLWSKVGRAVTEASETHWTLDKRISVGHIVATLMLMATMIAGAVTVSSRVAVMENNVQHNERAIRAVRADQAAQYAEIIRRLERLDGKLDRQRESE